MNASTLWIGSAVVVAAGLLIWQAQKSSAPEGTVKVRVPGLTAQGQAGQAVFESNCMACHGKNAGGSGNGPPLIHKIYEPGHHADFSFVMAVKRGVRSHHWRFGNMPPISGITDAQIAQVTNYVRELQRANGIH